MTERQFQVNREDIGRGIIVLTPIGDIDIYSAAAFKESLLDVIGVGWRHVLLDLTTVPLIDSTGLGVLVSAAKKARRGGIAIVCRDESMRLIFEVVGFDRLFAVFNDRAEAYAALTSRDSSSD